MDRIVEDDMGQAEMRLANSLKTLLRLDKEHQLSNDDVIKGIETVERRIGKKKLVSIVRFKDVSTLPV